MAPLPADPIGRILVCYACQNTGDAAIEAAAWALTIMHSDGVAIVPNEPLESYGADTLLPARSMALWSYTDFTDPRWVFEKETTKLRVDASLGHPQKFGVLNKQGWAAYEAAPASSCGTVPGSKADWLLLPQPSAVSAAA
jgi:hypothetical protein